MASSQGTTPVFGSSTIVQVFQDAILCGRERHRYSVAQLAAGWCYVAKKRHRYSVVQLSCRSLRKQVLCGELPCTSVRLVHASALIGSGKVFEYREMSQWFGVHLQYRCFRSRFLCGELPHKRESVVILLCAGLQPAALCLCGGRSVSFSCRSCHGVMSMLRANGHVP